MSLGTRSFVAVMGQGPRILMVHGFPRMRLTWRFLASQLAANHTGVCVDLDLTATAG
jgi:haloacetate dehalogenase